MKNFTWRKKLYFFAILIAIIPVAISSYNIIGIAEDELKSKTNEVLSFTANDIAEFVNDVSTNMWINPLKTIRDGIEVSDFDGQRMAMFIVKINQSSENLLALDLIFEIDKNEYASAVSTRNQEFQKLLDEKSINQEAILALNNDEIANLLSENKNIGLPKYIEELDYWLISVIVPVKIAGAPKAFLFAKYPLNNLRNYITKHWFNEDGKIMLIDKSGREVFDPIQKDLSGMSEVTDAVGLLQTGTRIQVANNFTTEQNEKIVCYYSFPQNIPWVVIAEISESKAYEAVSIMQERLLIYSVIGFGIAIISVLIFSGQIRKPILKISKIAAVISQGDFNVKNEYKANDEIGFLGDTLVGMADSLKESFKKIEVQNKELEEYSKTLELKVERRTIELKDKNEALQNTLEKLKQTQDQLVVQEKLASLGALTAGIAHEIQNPLNFVNNFSKLSISLVDELKEEIENHKSSIDSEDYSILQEILADVSTNMGKINEHGTRADRIVKGMLQHSRKESIEIRKVNINEMLKDTVNLAYHGFRTQDSTFNTKLENEFEENLPGIEANPQALDRVFLNIVNNGFYAANQRKKKEGESYSPTFKTTTRKVGDMLEVRLKDNGGGIPKHVLEKIFEPFFTTKPTGEGTGLGLSLSYDIIVQMHKGKLEVDTVEGESTEFIITLPINT
ncbi:MAG: ATP-binding protein [Bacteroidota bacterium]|nr:HAMP domain-containing protein [Bacteroidota bacterium]